MKKFAFLALLLLLYYIAGMYGSPALMVLFLTQLFLMAVMFLLSFYLRRHLSASFAEKLVSAEKDRPFAWKLRTDNSGKLPVSRFVLKYRIFGQEKRDMRKRKLYGNSVCGENLLTYEDTAGHCGIFTFRTRSLSVYDYLALFSRKRTSRSEMKVVVFPKKYEMKLETEPAFIGSEEPYPQSSFFPESGSGEIRQLREYRDGDLARHIHWNQTARTGRLWVKEYEEEAKGQVRLFLDLKKQEEAGPRTGMRFIRCFMHCCRGFCKRLPRSVCIGEERRDCLKLQSEMTRSAGSCSFGFTQTKQRMKPVEKAKTWREQCGLPETFPGMRGRDSGIFLYHIGLCRYVCHVYLPQKVGLGSGVRSSSCLCHCSVYAAGAGCGTAFCAFYRSDRCVGA